MEGTLLAPLPGELSDGVAVLRLIEPADWRVEVELSAQPDVVRWTRYPPDLDEDAARARIQRRRARTATGTGGRYVIRDGDGVAVGTAGIEMGPRGAPEVFYALLPAARGRGLATSAAEQLAEWALAAGHGVVLLGTVAGNDASAAVARRAGFTATDAEWAPEGGESVGVRRWERRPDRH